MILTRWLTSLHYLMVSLILFILVTANWWWRPRWLINLNIPAGSLFTALQNIQNSLNQPLTSSAYQAVYYSRFATVIFIGSLLALWFLSGFKGLYRLVGEVRFVWLLSLTLLVVWINLSIGWATQSPEVAQSHAMQWNLTLLFVLVISAIRPPLKWAIYALLGGMAFQGIIAVGQVAVQAEVGFRLIDDNYLKIGLGLVEFDLEPSVSGANIIQSRGVRFLRAHGFTPHPNLLAFGVVMSLVASLSLWDVKKRQIALTAVTVLGLWTLFLTFSRASFGGLIVGVGLYFGLSWLNGNLPRGKWMIIGRYALTVGMVMLVFVGVYSDLLATRAGVAEEGLDATVETRSIVDRQIYLEQAQEIMREHRWQGIGIGNFAWESNVRLQNDPRELDLQGSNVHNIYFLALSELGLIGGGLLVLNLGSAGLLIFHYWRTRQLTPYQLSLLASVGAWLAIGWFEFAPWALFTHQIPFWGTLSLALIPNREKEESATNEDIK